MSGALLMLGSAWPRAFPCFKHSGIERDVDSFTVAGAAPGSKRLRGYNAPSPASLFHSANPGLQSTWNKPRRLEGWGWSVN